MASRARERAVLTLGIVGWGDFDNVGADDLEAGKSVQNLLNFLWVDTVLGICTLFDV